MGAKPGKRREVSIGGRRVTTVDVHAHCFVPEVWDIVKDTPLAAAAKANDVPALQQSCKTCHKAFRKKYKEQFRTRPLP